MDGHQGIEADNPIVELS